MPFQTSYYTLNLFMRYFILFLSCIICLQALSQKRKVKEAFYVFDEHWESAKDLEHASYFMNMIPENDSVFICRYYKKDGPMVRQESYLDADLTIPNGRFAWYNEKGIIDSSGMVWRNKKDGYWHYYNDTIKTIRVKKYDKGRWLYTEDMLQKKKTYADGTIEDIIPGDTTRHVAANFPGGLAGWRKYMERNLEIPNRFKNLNQEGGKGVVVVVFLINKEGFINIEYITRSCEYSLDAEALRIIGKGPNWIPATIHGEKVAFSQMQGITFNYGH